jgi:hypothetical protein
VDGFKGGWGSEWGAGRPELKWDALRDRLVGRETVGACVRCSVVSAQGVC